MENHIFKKCFNHFDVAVIRTENYMSQKPFYHHLGPVRYRYTFTVTSPGLDETEAEHTEILDLDSPVMERSAYTGTLWKWCILNARSGLPYSIEINDGNQCERFEKIVE